MVIDVGKKKKIKDALGNEITYEKVGEEEIKEGKDKQTKIDIVSFDAIKWLISDLKSRIEDGWDNMVMITGQERSGKSTLGFHIYKRLAEELGLEYKLDQIYFSAKELHSDAKKGKQKQIYMLDEAGAELYGKEWYNEVQRSIVKLLQVIGKKNLTLILNLPHRTLLNKDIRNRRIHYWFHTKTRKVRMGDGRLKRKRGYATLHIPHTNKWSDSAFWEGKFTIKYPEISDEVWESYEEKKSEYIEKMSLGDYSNYKLRLYASIYSIVHYGDLPTREACKYLTYNRRAIYKILEEIRNNELLYEQIKDLIGSDELGEIKDDQKILKVINKDKEEVVEKETDQNDEDDSGNGNE